jgi:hypothetical protein
MVSDRCLVEAGKRLRAGEGRVAAGILRDCPACVIAFPKRRRSYTIAANHHFKQDCQDMKTSIKAIAAGLLAASGLSGCAWVELKPQGEKVRILAPQEVGRCHEMGRVSAVTAAKIGFIARPKDTVIEEVQRLGRNNAADMGGDTIVAAGPLIDGEQAFKVYRCINP